MCVLSSDVGAFQLAERLQSRRADASLVQTAPVPFAPSGLTVLDRVRPSRWLYSHCNYKPCLCIGRMQRASAEGCMCPSTSATPLQSNGDSFSLSGQCGVASRMLASAKNSLISEAKQLLLTVGIPPKCTWLRYRHGGIGIDSVPTLKEGDVDEEPLTCDLEGQQGQDLIEYTLLLAVVAWGAATLFFGVGGSISGLWSTSNSHLEVANSSVSS